MLSKFKNQRLLDQGWVIQTLNELSSEGWTNGANLKKLSGFNEKVYSIRGTLKGRLVFTVGRYQGQLSLFLLDILPNHDIPTHNTYDEQVRMVQNMIREEALPLEALDTQATRLALTTTEPVPVYEFNHNGLILSDEQNKLIKIDLEDKALMINGPPGSGKTSSLFIMLVERIEQETANEPKCYLYIARSKELAHFMREEWRQSGYEQRARKNGCTVRFSYAHCSLYNEVDEHFLYYPIMDKDRLNHARTIQKEMPLIIGVTKTKSWFDGKLNELRKRPSVDSKLQIDFESFLQEKDILCGYSREAYLSDGFGKRNSLFEPSLKKVVYDLYEEYLVFVATEINDQQVFDLSLCRVEQEQDWQYDLILVDETQDFSLGQLKDFRRLCPKNQIVMSIDSNQDLAKGLSLRTHIKGLFTRDNTCFVTSVSLVKSFRCPGIVIELANCLITLKNKITGGVTDKDEYSNFQMQSKDYGSGDVLWVNSQSLPQSQELLSGFIDTEIVVVAYADKKKAAQKRFPNYTVFTPEDIKGLEYPCVITYHLLDTPLFKEANSLLKKATDKVNIHRAKPEEARPRFAPDFNGVFTAITRSQKALVIIEDEVYELTHLMASLKKVVDRANQNPSLIAPHIALTQRIETTIEDWKKQVNDLVSQGKNRMADEVYNQRLKETLGQSFAEYIRKDELLQNTSQVQSAPITRTPNRKERKKLQYEPKKPLASENIKKQIQSLPPGVPKGHKQLITKSTFLLKHFNPLFLNTFLISEPVVQYRTLPLPEFNNQTLLDAIICDEDKRPILELLLTEKKDACS
ncbi:MAG: AAA family ATPase [Gammaproteobacteria bacterium]|nr:AAA family ATPase [Gammaproteobacteria bacterium]